MRAEFKRKLIATLIVPAMGVAAAGLSIAATDETSPETYKTTEPATTPQTTPSTGMHRSHSTTAMATAEQDMRASKIIGMRVVNPQGEHLGKIDDMVVDVNNERVHYAVLASGGALGMGEKLYAYPISQLQPATQGDRLVLNVDKDRLKATPGFDHKNWPDFNTGSYRGDVDRNFAANTGIEKMPNERLMRASQLIGKDVDDRNGKNTGEIKDLVVNLSNSRVHYAVLGVDKKWSMQDKLLPISLKSFTFPTERRKDLVLNADRDQLDLSHSFAKNSWPNINDPAYQRDVDGYIAGSVAGPSGPSGTSGRSRTDMNTPENNRSTTP